MERIRTTDLPPVAAEPGTSLNGSTETTNECPVCGGAGYYLLRVPYGDPSFGKLFACECQASRPLPGSVAMLARLRDELGQLADCTFDTFDVYRATQPLVWYPNETTYDEDAQHKDLRSAVRAATAYATAPAGWLYLFGNYGAGKSHLAAAIANTAARSGTRTTYASVPKLLDFIRGGYRDGSASERIDALSAAPLLILDDLGAEGEKRDKDELLFEILNHRSRERANLPTVITSNIHPDNLEPRIADRVYGQTDGGKRIVWLPIYSYRRLRQ